MSCLVLALLVLLATLVLVYVDFIELEDLEARFSLLCAFILIAVCVISFLLRCGLAIHERCCRRKVGIQELHHSCTIDWPDVPKQELNELVPLRPCQLQALANVRQHCKRLHLLALPHLRKRAEKLGFSTKNLDDTLSWMRERAPVIIHLDLAHAGLLLGTDSHYRNQFETQRSGGTLDKNKRASWENQLFSNAYKGASAFDRCKYGVVNVTNDPQGVRACLQYGLSYMLLRGVRLRTTFCSTDSAGMNVGDLATLDCCAHVFNKFSDSELRHVLQVGTLRIPGVDSGVLSSYKEAQIHGEVRLVDHVELIMAHPSCHSEALKELADRCQCPVVEIEGGIDTPALYPSPQTLGTALRGTNAWSNYASVRLPSIPLVPGQQIQVEVPGGQITSIVVPPGAHPGQQISIQLPQEARPERTVSSGDVWEVQCDDGWQVVNDNVLRSIRSALDQGKRMAQYEGQGFCYQLDFDLGVQENLMTGQKRMVRRRSNR